MKILSPEQIRSVERSTVARQQISMNQLMERAGTAVFEWICAHTNWQSRVFEVVCGPGNNGGDGLVLARLLHQKGATVRIWLQKSAQYSADNIVNQQRAQSLGLSITHFDEQSAFYWSENAIIIDALMGYGLNRAIQGGALQHAIEQINQSEVPVIAIDMPSGMFATSISAAGAPVVRATVCLSFEAPKLSMLLPEHECYLNNLHVLKIGLDTLAMDSEASTYHFTDTAKVRSLYKARRKFAYKYNFGNTLIIGGSKGKIGAVYLAAKAALRSGAGLVTAYVPDCGLNILQSSAPELMVQTDSSPFHIQAIPDISKYHSVVVGPGMGTATATIEAMSMLLSQDWSKKRLVIDADALNIMALTPQLLPLLPPQSILTPHAKELERLIGPWHNSLDQLAKAQAFAQQYNLILVVKGAYTRVVLPDGTVHFNSSGNPGMATAGSGDMLSGMIGALAGSGYTPEEAAITAVYLHGLAGDLAASEMGMQAMTAADIIRYLPQAFVTTFPQDVWAATIL